MTDMINTFKFRSQQLVKDFFGAGSETTATALGWILYFMLKYPEVQQKIRVKAISESFLYCGIRSQHQIAYIYYSIFRIRFFLMSF